MPLLASESGHTIEPSVQADANKQKSPTHAAGSDRELHAAQKFITTDLIKHGKVKLSDLGTDLDIINCLGKDKFTDVSSITKPGAYVVKPCELTTAKLKEIIEAGLNAEANAVELFVPVCFRSHWRLIKLSIKNNSLVDAILWDPLSNNNEVAYKLLQDAIESAESEKSKKAKKDSANAYIEPIIQAKAVAASVQTNNYSCMDYVIQEIYKSEGLSLDNAAIKKAPDANALRLAVIKQIATNVPELGKAFADNLKIKGDGIQESKDVTEEQLNEEQEKFLRGIALGKEVKKIQELFDDEFAMQIDVVQKEIKDDTKLNTIAFVKAYSIFKNKQSSEVAKALAAADAATASNPKP